MGKKLLMGKFASSEYRINVLPQRKILGFFLTHPYFSQSYYWELLSKYVGILKPSDYRNFLCLPFTR